MKGLKRYIAPKAFYMQVAAIALPIILHQFLANAAQFADSVMVGSLGSEVIAGVAASNQIFFIAMVTLFGINAAGAIFISQYLGTDNRMKIKEAVRVSYLLSMIWVLILFTVLQLFPERILAFFLQDEAAIEVGKQYLKLVSFAYLPLSISISTAIGFRAIGKTIYPMYIGIITLVVNSVMNYILIFGAFGFPQMGVQGAAIATVIARFVELGATFVLVLHKRPVTSIRPSSIFNFSSDLMKKVIAKAIPIFTNEFFWAFGMTVLVTLSANKVTDDLASISIANTISNLFYVLMSGLATAVSVIVGRTLGANKLKDAKTYANQLIFMATIIAIGTSFVILATSFIAPEFYSVSDEIKHNAQRMLMVTALFYPVYMLSAGIFFVMRSGGDTLSAAIMDSGMMWGIQVPFALLLALYTDFSMVERYLMVQSTNVIKLGVAYYFYRRGHWIRNLTLEVE